ncbi:MAG: SDR family oxidoreductase [Xanthomonadales bacterium]|nr:SDR family oxidoreductase [Xanthomonadales bacterium]
MDLSLHGRHALVGGASRGIGRATAIVLAELGASVTLMARSRDALEQARSGLVNGADQSHGVCVADASQPGEVGTAVAEIASRSAIHIVVNNTGGPPGGPAHAAGLEEYEMAFRQHVLCSQAILHAVLPGMTEAGFGRIVNVISTSVKQPIPNLGVSNTVRGAMASWAKTLASELGPRGITVNNVLPGFTETDRLAAIIESRAGKTGSSADEVAKAMKSAVPLRRFAQASETADAIAFLVSPAAAYINGVSLAVDGGRTNAL